ncbi:MULTISPECIES: hypothetical protein [unclassified Pseudomonas]|uniref:hypothetical protein n=1 Tax=unclassified Pseudomonas TaxID=196821 RepID=UPI0008398F81|nr:MULTISPECIES: hypothetical protein [unclassified Pseudomonas]QIH05505.1 hypothetical protein ATY02_01930 [Pseudomonas sp. BIOMIG1BAC]
MAKAQPNRVKAETLSLRISPELKFGLELLSRIEERSLTTQVEKALRELFATARMSIDYFSNTDIPEEIPRHEIYFLDILHIVNSVDAPTRLVRTAMLLPYTMNQREQVLMELIHSQTVFRGEDTDIFPTDNEYTEALDWVTENYFTRYSGISFKAIRKNWTRLNEVADQTIELGHYPPEIEWEGC